LTKSERELLAVAALQDDDLFAQLMEEEDLRLALANNAFRQELRFKLRKLQSGYQEPWSQRISGMFRAKWTIPVSALAALAVILLIRQGYIGESSPVANVVLGPSTISALHSAGILETPGEPERRLEQQSYAEPPARGHDASISFDRGGRSPAYQIGDRQRIGFVVDTDCRVLLVEERPDGSSVRLFPNRFQSSSLVPAKSTILIPPPGQGDLVVEGPTGRRTVRLLIFPPEVDPLQENVNWPELRERARVIDKEYEVKP
jgi:hypothetical protein